MSEKDRASGKQVEEEMLRTYAEQSRDVANTNARQPETQSIRDMDEIYMLREEVRRLHQKTYDIDDLYKAALKRESALREALEKTERLLSVADQMVRDTHPVDRTILEAREIARFALKATSQGDE